MAVGTGQNIGRPVSAPMVAMVKPRIAMAGLAAKFTAITRPIAPISIGTTKCQRRSLRRSAERPTTSMNTAASRYGIALSQPITRLSLKPRFLMIDGSQKLIAYTPLWMQK
ncbi:hypothetical protein D3C72_1364050 [compost metagenome]